MSKSIDQIEYDLIMGVNPEELADQEGWDRINQAIDNLNDRI